MQNASGSVDLGNRRVRGTKPDAGAAAPEASVATQRRDNARAARDGARPSSSDARGMVRAKKLTLADELALDAMTGPERNDRRNSKTERVTEIGKLLREGIDRTADLAGGSDDDTGAQGGPDGAEQETANDAPQTLETLAESLGVEVADLWQVEFNDGAGKTRTLGELKDLLKSNVDIDARELEFSERKSADENELMKQRQELEFVLSSLPKTAITPELKARATAERERVLKRERDRTLAAIAEWQKPEVEKAERAKIGEWITQFGFGAGDLSRMFDHRMLKLLRDSWQRHERVKAALEKVKEQKDTGAAPPAERGQRRRASAGPKLPPNASRTEKVAAVAELLRKGIHQE